MVSVLSIQYLIFPRFFFFDRARFGCVACANSSVLSPDSLIVPPRWITGPLLWKEAPPGPDFAVAYVGIGVSCRLRPHYTISCVLFLLIVAWG